MAANRLVQCKMFRQQEAENPPATPLQSIDPAAGRYPLVGSRWRAWTNPAAGDPLLTR